MTKRILNHRDSYEISNLEYLSQNVSHNYYPITSAISIMDQNNSNQMIVMNDRSQGGSSISNGSIELMMTRRMNTMDGYGIHEILNELEMQDKMYFSSGIKTRWTYYQQVFDSSKEKSKQRLVQQRVNDPP